MASVGGDGGPRGDDAVPDEGAAYDQEEALPGWLIEATASGQEPADPVWLRDYRTHVPIIGYLHSPADSNPNHLTLSQWEALMHSLSPGVRASYEGRLLEREDARTSEHRREKAEYAAFVEGRLRRLRERASGM